MSTEHLAIDSHVIRQLGDQLISDAEQALLELLKNAYDADASWTKVTISTDHESAYGLGAIVVEDNGVGMDAKAIKDGWLRVSFSMKRPLRGIVKEPTPKGRTPLGDKGLGRLSTMRLGRCVEIETYTRASPSGFKVTLDWGQFVPGVAVGEIDIPMKSVKTPPRTGQGTTLSVFGLEAPDYWKGKERRDQLRGRFSRLLSPFQEFDGFKIVLVVDSEKVELELLDGELRNSCSSRFFSDWNGNALACRGLVKLSLFRTDDNADVFSKYFEKDKGRRFAEYLLTRSALRDFGLERASDAGWFLESRRTRNVSPSVDAKVHVDCGPFRAELDSFYLGADAEPSETLFAQFQEYRDYIKRHAGVRVYRDGFEVRMPDDWLGLGKSWTSGKSYYGLKPSNTIGFVAITGAANGALAEKADREGFVDAPPYRFFRTLLTEAVGFANGLLHHIRRASVDYVRERRDEDAELPPEWTPQDAVKQLTKMAGSARARRVELERADARRRDKVRDAREELGKAVKGQNVPPAIERRVEKALEELDAVLRSFEEQRAQFQSVVDSVAEEEALARAILERFDLLRSQSDEVFEKVAVGLVAQAIAHDLNSLLEDLTARTTRVLRQAGQNPAPYLVTYTESVRAIAASLRKQVAFLEPMLRRGRENRQVIKVGKFVVDFAELRRESLEKKGIAITVKVRADFVIKMNQARLLQILENLVRNSEYWLKTAKERKEIRIDVSGPVVCVSDTGPGVREAIEDAIFDMFVSDKPNKEGAGLGLFICRTLLEAEDCTIVLEKDRNGSGRRFKFAVNLSGVLADARATGR